LYAGLIAGDRGYTCAGHVAGGAEWIHELAGLLWAALRWFIGLLRGATCNRQDRRNGGYNVPCSHAVLPFLQDTESTPLLPFG
jgi:hypothetical protein